MQAILTKQVLVCWMIGLFILIGISSVCNRYGGIEVLADYAVKRQAKQPMFVSAVSEYGNNARRMIK
jgi:hypothetical protein